MKGSEEVVLITWFTATLTSGFINWNDGHNGYKRVGLLRSKKRQRSIICGLLKVSRKGFEVFFCVCVCLFASCTCSVERISRRSEGQEWSEQPSKSWRNFNRWPPRNQNLGYCSLVFPLVWRDAFFLILPGIGFTEFGKILFLKYVSRLWVVSERF